MLNSFNLTLTFDYETIKNSIHLLNLKRSTVSTINSYSAKLESARKNIVTSKTEHFPPISFPNENNKSFHRQKNEPLGNSVRRRVERCS